VRSRERDRLAPRSRVYGLGNPWRSGIVGVARLIGDDRAGSGAAGHGVGRARIATRPGRRISHGQARTGSGCYGEVAAVGSTRRSLNGERDGLAQGSCSYGIGDLWRSRVAAVARLIGDDRAGSGAAGHGVGRAGMLHDPEDV